MKNIFQIGDKKRFSRTIEQQDQARFDAGTVHQVYATFALARDAEWACRLFVIDMKEAHEEGIGTFIRVDHVSPALTGSRVDFEATLERVSGAEVICSFEAKVGMRLIAKGETGQKVLEKTQLDRLFSGLKLNQ